LRPLQDGSGNNLPVEVSTTGVNFTGTVTGDNNTTYDFGAAGAAGNINLALTGSDATNDVVTIQAGTNITLTDNGSNNFTIDAAGGGGGGTTGVSIVPSSPISFTGPSSNDTVIASVLIPGGTFQNGDILRLDAFQSMDFSAGGWIYSSIWIQSDATTPYGIESLGQIQTPSGRDGNYFKTLYLNGDSTWYRTYTTNADMTAGAYSGDPTYMAAIDWTQDWYLNFNTWVDNAGTIIYFHGMKLTKIN
jgi:hypothetical protein